MDACTRKKTITKCRLIAICEGEAKEAKSAALGLQVALYLMVVHQMYLALFRAYVDGVVA
jgi:hypothetical protein